MLKFILLALLLFLAVRFVLKLFGRGLFIHALGQREQSAAGSSPFIGKRKVEETDYEVLDSQMKDNDAPVR
ncbi:MAG: hypothetical protein HGA81_07460 [Chlorobium limicola]|uniref:Uncharacterized protein n=1 Tax=Chlorobium limicola (strain DSM 245 / NBRC 103803 / 6330) TaxID=290315 RepID=B3EFA8_CHLL2|nr:hypothetical protein [Chlorobium limicola]ACD89391.1 conserved hypothetical protein [Chlorobium limicola DSM 245]NTV08425.1 hypothetical protein [Chlorobium limicola]NTV20204.1 hypothetical protein [Chlorobium limicola]